MEKELDAREGVAVPEGETWFKVVEGTIPVIITAPHATRPLRNGKRRFSDGGGTAALAVALGELTGATVMYTTYEGDSDPNYYDDNVFKEKLKELIDRIKPEYVLDLHGSHSYRSYDIDLGTMRDRSLLGRTKLVKMLIEHLKRENIANISYNRFSASKHETVTKFSSANGVPAIQMEINMTWISPKDGWIEAQRFSILAQAMTRFILTAKK
ncbi:MAG: ketol-acid reductoisomerase [Acidobacteriota bacterium]|nr:ketol-acid reductoisomerase [Acidobacteriota bacterium]